MGRRAVKLQNRGFTLLEVVVALAVLSVSLALVLQIFSGGLKNIRRIELAHRAMSHGENVMSEILSDREIQGPTTLSGDLDEEFSYSAEVTDWEEPSETLTLDVATVNLRLLDVQVRINFKNDRFGKFYRLQSLKAVSMQPAEPGNTPVADRIRELLGGRSR